MKQVECPCSTYNGVSDYGCDYVGEDYEGYSPILYGPHSVLITHIVKQDSVLGGYQLFYVCRNHADFYRKASFEIFPLPLAYIRKETL